MAITKVSRDLLSTGVSDSSDATAITITSDEKVGIGTANPSQLFTIESNSFPILQISNTLNNNPADGVALDMVEKQDGYAASTATFGQTGVYGYRLKLNGSTNQLILQSGSQTTTNDRVTVERDTGNVTLNTGNLVIGTAGKGIDFGASGDGSGASVSSEVLKEYEEGTFTPTIKDGSGNAYTGSYATRNGRYTKIGRIVHLTFEMYVGASLTSGGLSGSAEVQIGGLPFTSNSTNFTGGIVSNGTGINYEGDTCYLRIARNVDYISLRSFVADTGSCERAVTVTRLDNSTRLVYGTISYEAA